MSKMKNVLTEAGDFGFAGNTMGEMFEFINTKYPEFVKTFSPEDWETLENAYVDGRADFVRVKYYINRGYRCKI